MSEIISIEMLRAGRAKAAADSQKKVVKLQEGLIQQADAIEDEEYASEHSAEPIKDVKDIERICTYLLDNKRYRDYMLFVVGINFGLRVSDLVELRFCHIINDNLTFKETFPIFEKKTRNTRKRKKNRYVTINDAVIEAVTVFLENTNDVKLSDYMFQSQANNKRENKPLTRKSVDRILKGIAEDLDLNIRMSTHTLRKSFAYHMMMAGGNDPRTLLLLSKLFGHSSVAVTMDYIGITDDEIRDAYKSLNLGSSRYFQASRIEERVDEIS